MKSTFETTGYMTFCSQARRTCGTTHCIRPCTILHATGIGLPPNLEDWIILHFHCYFNDKYTPIFVKQLMTLFQFILITFIITEW
jgi:hypothetical protein